ncbi:FAD-dependent monooxygenase [Microbacterium sp. KR10-403]|uniref:FAD-dependent monooxygenase n=1 Tax=Microbacterium sp. KR10-403 TaxID=3158581 RepID=UPI0032E3E4C0
METLHQDVFIVGAGPTGLACAALLARDGIGVTAITRYPGFANSPRAHIINQRTMEVFRDLGIEQRIVDAAMPASFMGQVVWAETLAGREIARRRGWGAGADRLSDYAKASPCAVANIPQHVLEPIVSDAAQEFGADIRFNLELVRMRQEPDRVISLCRDRVTGDEVEVISRYAVGADGDNSVVCREIGFDVVGQAGLGHMVNYWVETDLAAYTAHRPGSLYQVFRPGGAAFTDNAMFVNVKPWNEWVVAVPYDPAVGPDRSEEAANALVRRYVGADVRVRLIGASTWTINEVHAELLNKGRVIIAGNAAHRHPPAGGLGANTCVQDSFALAYKLAALVRGTAGPGILDDYTRERVPVARQIVARANRSLEALMAIPAALGLEPGLSAKEGDARMHTRFTDTAAGAVQRAKLDDALYLQDYNFNASGLELGHHYVSDGITPDGATPPAEHDAELYYEPSTTPGSPLPHAWVARPGQAQISTLDLVGRGRFTLLTGIGGEGWADAAAGLDVDVVVIGPGCAVEDPYGDWASLRGTDEAGCVLVRPDHHIAYRSSGAPGADAASTLSSALDRALGRAVVRV